MSTDRTTPRPRWLLALAWVVALGCHRGGPTQGKSGEPVDAGARAPDARPHDEAGAEADAGAAPGSSFREAIRHARWEAAEAAATRMTPAEQAAPDVRLARARAALERADYKQAYASLAALEQELPLLDARIKDLRLRAMAEVGPFDAAGEAFLRRGSPRDLLAAARAFERSGAHTRARQTLDRALAQSKRARAFEEEARTLRLGLSGGGDPAALDDARWLAVHAASPADAEHALTKLSKLGGALTPEEWLARARDLTDLQRPDDAIKAIARAAAGRPAPSEDTLCHARAEALYKARSRYSEAAAAYGVCERRGGARAAEDAFLAARALSRADRDREAEAGMHRVRDRYPRSTFAEEARFHLGRIALLHGDHAAAVRAFDELALDKRGAKGSGSRAESARYRALAHFAAHDYRGARRLFEALADDAQTPDLRARAKNLAALSALRDGDRTHAVARWSDVVRSRPLSFAALVAQARLAEAKAPPVPWLEPAGGPPQPLAVTLPAPVDLLHAVGLDDDAEDELRAREGFIESAYPGRGVQALCAAYAATGRARRQNQLGLRVPSSLLSESPDGRARWAWECVFPRPFPTEVAEAEQANSLVPGLVHAIMRQESGFNPDVVSPARAVGLMQLLPETARAVAAHAKLPHEDAWLTRPGPNIALGARYLRELGEKLGGDPLQVAGAYNAGPEAMTRWVERAKGVDLETFVESIPYLETRGYVVRVMDNLARYGFASAGEAGIPKVHLTL